MTVTARRDGTDPVPVDYLVLHIVDGVLGEQQWSALAHLLRRGDLRLLGVAVVRAAQGKGSPRRGSEAAARPYVRLEVPPELRAFTDEEASLLSDDDVDQVALDLPDGQTAAVLLLQSTWLTALIRGFGEGRCRLVHSSRLPGPISPAWRLDPPSG
jgi:hypothetical protein